MLSNCSVPLSLIDPPSYSSRQSDIDNLERMRREQINDKEIICQIIQAILCRQNNLTESTFTLLTDRLTGRRHKAWLIKSEFVYNIAYEEWWLLSNGKVQHYQEHILLESFIAEADCLALYLCGKTAFIELANSLGVKLQDDWR